MRICELAIFVGIMNVLLLAKHHLLHVKNLIQCKRYKLLFLKIEILGLLQLLICCFIQKMSKSHRPFSYSKKSLDRVIFLYIFICKVLLSGVRASSTIAHILNFDKTYTNIACFRFFFRIAKRSIVPSFVT